MPRAPGPGPSDVVRLANRSVEETFQAAKSQVGMDEHEVRKWSSWYRHTTVCMLAVAFLATVRSHHIPAQPPEPDPES